MTLLNSINPSENSSQIKKILKKNLLALGYFSTISINEIDILTFYILNDLIKSLYSENEYEKFREKIRSDYFEKLESNLVNGNSSNRINFTTSKQIINSGSFKTSNFLDLNIILKNMKEIYLFNYNDIKNNYKNIYRNLILDTLSNPNIENITDSFILRIDYEKQDKNQYKPNLLEFFETRFFSLENYNYLNDHPKVYLLTPKIIDNLKKLRLNILLPIVNFINYKNNNIAERVILMNSIYCNQNSIKDTQYIKFLKNGIAIELYLIDYNIDDLIENIKNNDIADLSFGFIKRSEKKNCFIISLEYNIDDTTIRNRIL
jgi:hypothetical protein